jgi:hypothetical protein
MGVPLCDGGEKKFNWASEFSIHQNPVFHGVFSFFQPLTRLRLSLPNFLRLSRFVPVWLGRG